MRRRADIAVQRETAYPFFAMSDVLTTLPEGAENISRGGFNLHAGPIYRLPAQGEAWRFALPVQDKHMNGSGSVHGGLLMTFADIAMSQTARAASGAASCSTVALTCDFVGPGKAGDILEATVRVTRKTRTLVFLAAEIACGARVVASATGLWKIG
ncbi:MAG TPA: PaaI family thioesterase [Rhizomicrobium sp.]